MSIVIDSIADIGVAVGREKIIGIMAEHKAHKWLEQFLQAQKEILGFCPKEEELDFQGLAEYIQTDMIEDIKRQFFGQTPKERNEARETIRHKAMAYAQANTALSQDRAATLADKAVNILQQFQWERLDKELAFAVTEIEDTLSAEMVGQHQSQSEQLEKIEKKLGQENLLSMDHILSAMDEGRFDEVAKKVMSIQNAISSTHKLFPHYGFALKNGRYESVPLTEEAEKKYPIHFCIKASSAWMGDEKTEEIDTSLLMRAYHHQLPLKLERASITKYLGKELDPIQAEAEMVNGKTVTITPSPFPEAFPCGIYVNDFVLFDDLRMRIKEIFDDNSILLTNEEQTCRSFNVKYLTFPCEDRFELSITPKNTSHIEFLRYLEAMDRIRNGGEIRIKDLAAGKLLDVGTADKADKTEEKRDPRVIETLRKIVAIEQYFGVVLDCFRTLQWEDYNTINRVYDVITGRGCISTTPSMDFSFQVEKNEQKDLLALISTKHKLIYSTIAEVKLLDQVLMLPLHREAPCIAVLEPEKVLKKIEVLEAGDTFKLTFVPGNGEKSIELRDTLASETDDFSTLSYQMPEN